MNRDIETFPEKFFAWLLQSQQSSSTLEDEEIALKEAAADDTLNSDIENCDIENWELDDFELLESEVLNSTISSTSTKKVLPQGTHPGDIPAVQERFQALIKRRIQMELAKNPPLFPWETEVAEYESDDLNTVISPQASGKYLWISQMEKLRLSVEIPPEICLRLLDRAMAVLPSSMAQETKLVRTVEAIFPGNGRLLTQFAQKVLGFEQNLSHFDFSQAAAKFPRSYGTAKENEQMVLLLLAAKQIFGFLTLVLAPINRVVEREWLCGLGMLKLQAEYQLEALSSGSLRVQGWFPCGGVLKLQAGQAYAQSERPDPGWLSVELFDLALNQNYPLSVQLNQPKTNSLIFSICPTR